MCGGAGAEGGTSEGCLLKPGYVPRKEAWKNGFNLFFLILSTWLYGQGLWAKSFQASELGNVADPERANKSLASRLSSTQKCFIL